MKFDRVELRQEDGSVRVLTPDEFRTLQAVDRVQWIAQGRFRFFLGERKVRPADAINADRQTA